MFLGETEFLGGTTVPFTDFQHQHMNWWKVFTILMFEIL